jgi:uncharacterized membrane protein
MATALMIWAITDFDSGSAMLGVLAYILWVGALYGWYRHVRPDLFMLAGGVLSLIVAVVTLLVENIVTYDSSGAFLLIGLVVIGMSAGGALWLKTLMREQLA